MASFIIFVMPRIIPKLTFPAIAIPQRRKRFVRSEPLAFQLTDRDIELVRLVAKHRFLRSTHLSDLVQAWHKKICERLTGLFHARSTRST